MKKTILICGLLVVGLALLGGCYPYDSRVDLGVGSSGYYGDPYGPYGDMHASYYPYYYPAFGFSYYYPYYPYYYPYYPYYRGAYPYYPYYRGAYPYSRGARYYPYYPYYGTGRSNPYYYYPSGGRQYQGTAPGGGTGGRTYRR